MLKSVPRLLPGGIFLAAAQTGIGGFFSLPAGALQLAPSGGRLQLVNDCCIFLRQLHFFFTGQFR